MWNGIIQIQEITNIFDYLFDYYLFNQEHKNPLKQPFFVNNKYHQLVFVLNSSEHKKVYYSILLIDFIFSSGAVLTDSFEIGVSNSSYYLVTY